MIHAENSGLTMDKKEPYILIKLTRGFYAKVDTEDYEKVSSRKWYMNTHRGLKYAKSHVVINGKRTTMSMHRLIMKAGNRMEVDHINHDGLDNRKSNLRVCTHKQNLMNSGNTKNSKSKYKGVSPMGKKWRAVSRLSGTQRYLGCYETQIEAAIAYDDEVLKHGDIHAYINFPERRNAI